MVFMQLDSIAAAQAVVLVKHVNATNVVASYPLNIIAFLFIVVIFSFVWNAKKNNWEVKKL